MGEFPEVKDYEKIPFKFTKPGFNKLLIFDLDETLIHSLRTDDDEYDFDYLYEESERMDKSQLNRVEVADPSTQERQNGCFYIRPFVNECLQAVNSKYEVAIFTIATDWYANPIINKLDPNGTLI